MGYYTVYNLTKIKGSEEDFEALKKDLRETKGVDLEVDCNLKWYDHEEDLKKLSEKYPDLIIQLEGDGEDVGDNWTLRFAHGIVETEPFVVTTSHKEVQDTLMKKFDKFENDLTEIFDYAWSLYEKSGCKKGDLRDCTLQEIRDLIEKLPNVWD